MSAENRRSSGWHKSEAAERAVWNGASEKGPVIHCPACGERFFGDRPLRSHLINEHRVPADVASAAAQWCESAALRAKQTRTAGAAS